MSNYILILFLNGIFFGAGPCMVSCGPLILSYCVGTKRNLKESLKVWLMFSLSRLVVYIALGIIAGIFSQIALERFYSARLTDVLFICAGAFILIMGIIMFFDNKIEHNLCKTFQAKFIQKNKYAAILLGLITGILPCGPLLGILFFIALISKNYLEGAIFSFSFGLGTFLSPLFILVVFAGAVPKLLAAKPKIYLIFKRISALVICYLGLSLILSVFK